ncbi:MAG: response regulator, partial [Campylobacterota bacterium]
MSKFLQTATILYVEDDKSIQEGYVRALQRYGKEVFIANDGKEGLALYQKHNPDIIVSDI